MTSRQELWYWPRTSARSSGSSASLSEVDATRSQKKTVSCRRSSPGVVPGPLGWPAKGLAWETASTISSPRSDCSPCSSSGDPNRRVGSGWRELEPPLSPRPEVVYREARGQLSGHFFALIFEREGF